MDKKFERAVNSAVDAVAKPKEPLSDVTDILKDLDDTEESYGQAKDKLRDKESELCMAVGVELKKRLPKVKVEIGENSCTFKYYARSIGLQPDVKQGLWSVVPGPTPGDMRLISQFASKWDGTEIKDYAKLVDAMAQLFVGHYKTLRGGRVPEPEIKPRKSDKDELNDEITSGIDALAGPEEPAPMDLGSKAVKPIGTSKASGGGYA